MRGPPAWRDLPALARIHHGRRQRRRKSKQKYRTAPGLYVSGPQSARAFLGGSLRCRPAASGDGQRTCGRSGSGGSVRLLALYRPTTSARCGSSVVVVIPAFTVPVEAATIMAVIASVGAVIAGIGTTTQRTGGPPLVLNSEMARAFVLSVRSSGRAAPPSGRAFALGVLGNGPL